MRNYIKVFYTKDLEHEQMIKSPEGYYIGNVIVIGKRESGLGVGKVLVEFVEIPQENGEATADVVVGGFK